MLLLFKKSLLLIPVLFAMGFINYRIDPGSYFSGRDYSSKVVDLLLDGNCVVPRANIEMRLFQKHYIAKIEQVDVAAFGSSRILQMHADLFPGRKFVNNSVNQGSFEDYVAICQLYRQKNFWPGEIILGLDPWVLNVNNSSTEWSDLASEYKAMAGELGFDFTITKKFQIQKLMLKRFSMLFSPAYFQKSVKVMLMQDTYLGAPPVIVKNLDEVDEAVFLPDGSMVPLDRNKRPVEEVNESAVDYANLHPLPFLEDFNTISSNRLAEFDRFLDYLQQKGVTVKFFLTPFHPVAFRILKTRGDCQIIFTVEKKFREIATIRHIDFIGSYDPDVCGLGGEHFFDGAHHKGIGVAKIYNSFSGN